MKKQQKPKAKAKAKGEQCSFRHDYDPETLEPRGRKCRARAIEEIHWKDGRVSVACKSHGLGALESGVLKLVEAVRPLRA